MAQNWNDRLRATYRENCRQEPDWTKRPVRLPADGAMSVSGEANHAVIALTSDAIVRNMQSNAAAFEGWSLALRQWCGAEKVTLSWQAPVPQHDPKENRHYQRFLYRVERFSSLFEWFDVATPDRLAPWRQPTGNLYLNVAGDASKPKASDRESSTKSSPETELERRLLTDEAFHRHYKFAGDANETKVVKDRQFPVGLFLEQRPTAASAVFPGGKGAIDLVCLDDRHLWLFELKARKNISVGTITEVLFYVSVIRDAVMGKFRFGVSAGDRAIFRPEMVEQVDEITGVMLGHDLHPLIGDPKLLALLNDAVKERWNCVSGSPAVSFRADQIETDQPLKIARRG